MTDKPERIWAWYDAEYEVVTGSLSEKTHEPSAEYVRADLATSALAAKDAEIARLNRLVKAIQRGTP